ncbi:glucose-6-phosphate isomerase [Delftia lacustris]|uniref:glucose-6-phosphate isomerase n=1 Tax=Delftia TaxID=80865 RepID=UPI000926E9AA|nr:MULTISPECIES: glucose-6-phosphate isomerase [Delftia]PZP73603.1 MAG: glucose-6-phosphate isomerase [Delftia acidovorans]MDH0418758.1 glucose-6-phosphate isomerase [Delftia tsuruhatensis]OJX11475.1 MAG: glucose-6-phosphate isomerase [Delftia sp. 67-8]QFS63764.1 glucose-6-phosphate isomerase [Delftia tsuruhatensis]QRI91405.1 glucose-6-phosphate isomerase [Delftia lacustris]
MKILPVLCNTLPAWSALERHFNEDIRSLDLRQAFAADAGRLDALSQQAPHVFADLSKNLWTERTEELLRELAQQTGVLAQRDAMLAGEPVNCTEGRAVMHWLLRMPRDGGQLRHCATVQQWQPAMHEALAQVHETLDAMLALAEQVRGDEGITDIVNIGIGGSHLGPEVVVNALEDWVDAGKNFHFVSNVDGHELGHVLRRVRPHSTLFLIASKSFTTAETMLNAHSARRWFLEQGGSEDAQAACSIDRHFVALTTNVQAAADFGIRRTLGFWDWVGGRFSLWSAIGLPVAIAIGAAQFRALLDGAHAMDAHFFSSGVEGNLPLRLGLLDVWYRDFCGFSSRCIAPYSHGLRRLTAYLQQLEMESNGKGVTRDGQTLPVRTAPVIWGEPGTNGQHAFFQMLHQGQDVIPVEFIALRDGGKYLGAHHQSLVVNAIAQAQALMEGRHGEGAERHCAGNRPSSFLLLQQLDPASLGALIALYEHRVFSAGAVWGINSFDQWGVELGKHLARQLHARQDSGDWQGVDASTQGLMHRLAAGAAG